MHNLSYKALKEVILVALESRHQELFNHISQYEIGVHLKVQMLASFRASNMESIVSGLLTKLATPNQVANAQNEERSAIHVANA